MPGSAAEAGLQEGDLIVSANGVEMRSIESLHEQLLAMRGKTLKLEILHGLEKRSVYLYVNESPDE
jgi:S1-C subfamily serine protease